MRRGTMTILVAVLLAVFGGVQVATATQRLTEPAAKHYIKKAMKHEFGSAFKYGNGKRIRDCKRLSRIRMRCTVSWGIGDSGYSGKVAIWYRGPYYLYRYRLKVVNEYCIDTGGSNCTDVVSGSS